MANRTQYSRENFTTLTVVKILYGRFWTNEARLLSVGGLGNDKANLRYLKKDLSANLFTTNPTKTDR